MDALGAAWVRRGDCGTGGTGAEYELYCYDIVVARSTSLKAVPNYVAMERHSALPFISISIQELLATGIYRRQDEDEIEKILFSLCQEQD